jgi:hypothetical protein
LALKARGARGLLCFSALETEVAEFGELEEVESLAESLGLADFLKAVS